MDPTKLASHWAFIGLIVFIGLMIYLKVPKFVMDALDKRSAKIRTDLEEARALREEAQALLAEYQRKRLEAEGEAEAIIDQAKREAAVLAAEAKTRLEEYVDRRTKAVEQRIAQAEAQAVAEVRGRAIDVAAIAAGAVLAEKAEGPSGNDLVDQSIDAVKSRLKPN